MPSFSGLEGWVMMKASRVGRQFSCCLPRNLCGDSATLHAEALHVQLLVYAPLNESCSRCVLCTLTSIISKDSKEDTSLSRGKHEVSESFQTTKHYVGTDRINRLNHLAKLL